MQDLPLELLIDNIWPNLSLFDVYRRARYTCKLWNSKIEQSIKSLNLLDEFELPGRHVQLRSYGWQNSNFLSRLDPKRITGELKISTTAYTGAKEYLHQTLSRFQYVSRLVVTIAHPEGNLWGIDHAIAKLEQLQELSIYCNSWPFDDELTKILAPKIVSLRLASDAMGLLIKFSRSLNNLRDMRIEYVEGDIASYIPHLSSLRNLDYSCGPWDIENLPSGLVGLSLICNEIGELPNLEASAKTLKHLRVCGLNRLNAAHPPPSFKLVSLDMQTCDPRVLEDLAISLSNLQCFTFRCRPDYPLLASQLQRLTSVSTLVLYAPVDLEPSFLSYFPKLKRLNLHSQQSSFVDVPEELWPTPANCPNLLSLSFSMYATPSRLLEGLEGLSSLESLRCLCLSDSPISTHAWSALASLTSLTYLALIAEPKSSAVSKSEEDVLYLCEKLERLRHLHLEEVVAIEDASVLKRLCDNLHSKHPALDRCYIATTPKNYVEPDW